MKHLTIVLIGISILLIGGGYAFAKGGGGGFGGGARASVTAARPSTTASASRPAQGSAVSKGTSDASHVSTVPASNTGSWWMFWRPTASGSSRCEKETEKDCRK